MNCWYCCVSLIFHISLCSSSSSNNSSSSILSFTSHLSPLTTAVYFNSLLAFELMRSYSLDIKSNPILTHPKHVL